MDGINEARSPPLKESKGGSIHFRPVMYTERCTSALLGLHRGRSKKGTPRALLLFPTRVWSPGAQPALENQRRYGPDLNETGPGNSTQADGKFTLDI